MRQTTSGVMASVISTGALRTPLGKGVADSPSCRGRAPAPPEWNVVTLNAAVRLPPASVSPCPAARPRFQRLDVPSAGTLSGSARWRQPWTRSGSMCPMVERAKTAAGRGGFTMVSAGAETVTASSVPVLFGTQGATSAFTPNAVYASV